MVEFRGGVMLRKGYSPSIITVWIKSHTIFKLTFKYTCSSDVYLHSNVYMDSEDGPSDFPHQKVKLKANGPGRYAESEITVSSGNVIGEQFAKIRLWTHDKHPVRIKECYVEILDEGEYAFSESELSYKKLYDELNKEEEELKEEEDDEERIGYVEKKKKKKKKRRKIVLVIDKARNRSPLLTMWQKELCKSKQYFFVRDDRLHLHLADIVNRSLRGRLPDLIYAGFDTGLFFINSKDYIVENRIPVMSETGDNDLFGRQRICTQRVKDIPIRLLICHSLYHIENVYNRRSDFWFLKGAEVVYVPWCIDYKKYQMELKRDIDVTCISTATPGWPFHKNKLAVKAIVKSMTQVDGKPITRFTQNVYGDDYIKVLNRTKIAVVAGRGRMTLPQKYLESAAAGCMLIGEIPPELDGILEDGESIIGVEMGNYMNLKSLIAYYLKHPEERKRIAENGRKAIEKHLGVDVVAKNFLIKLSKLKIL
jgi:hypothetical protein